MRDTGKAFGYIKVDDCESHSQTCQVDEKAEKVKVADGAEMGLEKSMLFEVKEVVS